MLCSPSNKGNDPTFPPTSQVFLALVQCHHTIWWALPWCQRLLLFLGWSLWDLLLEWGCLWRPHANDGRPPMMRPPTHPILIPTQLNQTDEEGEPLSSSFILLVLLYHNMVLWFWVFSNNMTRKLLLPIKKRVVLEGSSGTKHKQFSFVLSNVKINLSTLLA